MYPDDKEILQRLFFPRNAVASMFLWAGLSAGVGLFTTLLGTTVLKEYGTALFCGVPLMMGFLAPWCHGLGARRSFANMFLANMLAQFCLFWSLLFLGIEGLGCLIMCAPLWSVL